MATSTFSVFLDENPPSQVSPINSPPSMTSSRKPRLHDTAGSTTKENINPLTGLSFDVRPPLKKRKPSPSSALKVKALSSSSSSSKKFSVKTKKPSSLLEGKKERGKKKRAVLGSSSENRNIEVAVAASDDGSDTEHSLSLLGDRKAYKFTVMPLADVTQAYDEHEAFRAAVQGGLQAVEEKPEGGGDELFGSKDNDIEMRDTTSKEAIESTIFDAIEA